MDGNSDHNKKYRLRRFQPPSVEFTESIGKPFKAYFATQYLGMENVDPSKPYLFVTNHTVYGITDGLLFGIELYKKKGVFLRPLVDDMHFMVPYWREKATQIGFIRASRENCTALMEAGENILVFPGGGRETWKHKGEQYKLLWKNHLGFARMAIQHDYEILPVAQVGGEDAFDIVADGKDIMQSPFGRFLEKTGIAKKYLKDGEIIPPISKGLFGMYGIPKPVKLYTKFGKPISTVRFKRNFEDEETLWQLRNEVELAMSKLFIDLLEYRKKDKEGGLIRRLLSR